MSSDAAPAKVISKDQLVSHLHLHAVLPALAELCTVSEEARALLKSWRFPLGFSLRGGPAAFLRPSERGDSLKVLPHARPAAGRGLTLLFLNAGQLNRTFLNQRALPPLPLGQIWLAAKLRPFFALTQLLQSYLQPSEAQLRSAPEQFVRDHLLLTFGVLMRAVRLVGLHDAPSRDTMSHTPAGTMELRAPGLPATAWLRWDGKANLESGPGSLPATDATTRLPPDATLTFRDLETIGDALHNRLDPLAAVGSGRVLVTGLVPLADALGFVMDRVEVYLRP